MANPANRMNCEDWQLSDKDEFYESPARFTSPERFRLPMQPRQIIDSYDKFAQQQSTTTCAWRYLLRQLLNMFIMLVMTNCMLM